jgi:alpha-tubulin suppressor-like RCC1 family protein
VGGEGHHHLAIKSVGTLWGWGQNVYGQLGDGTSGLHNKQSIPVPSAPGNDWKQAAVGDSHSLAIKRNGALWAWGANWAGQLGIGSTNILFPQPVQVGVGTNWTKAWAGYRQSVAQQSGGSLWYWGDNPNPAIPNMGPGAINILSPMQISAETNWVSVGFGLQTVLALKSDGTLWAWGREAHAFTGEADQAMNIIPTRLGTTSDWLAMCPSGHLYHLLLKKDGSVWSLLAERAALLKPVRVRQIDLSKKDIAAFAGRGNSLRPMGVVLTRDGEVWTWGKVLAEYVPDSGNPEWGGDRKPLIQPNPWQLPNEE